MTKEEKIAVLKALWRYKDCGYSEYEIRESLEFAIEELLKEPCEDCWSKKEVVDIINRQRFGINKISMGIIKEKLEALPSVTPTHKKGKWENLDSYHYYNDGEIETAELRCSCCNEIVEWDIESPHKPYYCENCGAEMESAEDA